MRGVRANKSPKVDFRLQVLLHEHSMLRDEVVANLGFYRKSIAFVNIVISGVFVVFTWFFSNGYVAFPLTVFEWWAFILLFPILNLFCTYYFFDFLHCIYTFMLIHSRARVIEDQIAEICGPNLIIWEKIARPFHSKFRPSGILNPSYFHSFIFFVLLMIVMFIFPVVGYLNLWPVISKLQIECGKVWLSLAASFSFLLFFSCIFYSLTLTFKADKKMYNFVDEIMIENVNNYNFENGIELNS